MLPLERGHLIEGGHLFEGVFIQSITVFAKNLTKDSLYKTSKMGLIFMNLSNHSSDSYHPKRKSHSKFPISSILNTIWKSLHPIVLFPGVNFNQKIVFRI